MANPITSGAFPKLFDKNVREVFSGVWEDLTKAEGRIDTLFRRLPSDSNLEEFYEVGAIPDIPKWTGAMQYLPVYPGFYNKITPAEYGGGLIFERKFLDDKKFNVMMDNTAGLFESAYRVQEKAAADIFNHAFSSAFDFVTSEEAVAWCSSAHTTKSGVSTSSGFANAGTSALDKTSVAATWLLMRRFKNDIGERISINPDTLIVPDALADKAGEIIGTPSGLYSGESTKNMLSGRFKVVSWRLLDDNSTADWFMADSRMLKRFLIFLDRIKPEPHTFIDNETLASKVTLYMRFAAGPTQWRMIYGQNVA